MKTIKYFLAAAFAFGSFAASAQTADDIVAKYVTAMGGAEKLSSLKTVKMEGNMSTQGIDIALTVTKKQLAGMRLDLDIMGTSNFQMATPEKGWIFMPIMQQAEPKEMDAFYFVDATTGLLLKVVTKAMAQGAEIEVQNVYTDYKKNEDGYMFPYTSTNEQGVITFDKISTNVPVDDKIFTN